METTIPDVAIIPRGLFRDRNGDCLVAIAAMEGLIVDQASVAENFCGVLTKPGSGWRIQKLASSYIVYDQNGDIRLTSSISSDPDECYTIIYHPRKREEVA